MCTMDGKGLTMNRGSNRESDENSSFSDGEFFVRGIARFSDLCKDSRVVPSKRILREIGAKQSSLVAWEIEDGSVFIYGIDPETINELELPESDGVLILKQITDDKNRKFEPFEDGEINVIQVKSQGRVGTRNQVLKILKKAGIGENDWLIPQFINNKEEGPGWRIYGVKKENLLFTINKKIKEEKESAVVPSS